MSRDNIIGLLLIAAIFIGYSILTAPTEEQKQETRRIQDSIRELRLAEQEMLREEQSRVVDESTSLELESLELPEIHEEGSDSLRLAALKNQLGYFAGAATKEKQSITIESELLKLNFSTKGGFVESAELKNTKHGKRNL
jgi:YidC/Oxa1 family membrane protein insertase